jgi:hypothetical protein
VAALDFLFFFFVDFYELPDEGQQFRMDVHGWLSMCVEKEREREREIKRARARESVERESGERERDI